MVRTQSVKLRGSSLLTLAAILAGCSTRENVTEPELRQPFSTASVSQSERYYLHEREKIEIRPDTRRLVISTSIDDVEALVATAFAGTPNVKVTSSERLSVPNHRAVEVAGASEEAIARARQVLLKEPRVEFVSQAYVTTNGNHPILLGVDAKEVVHRG